MSFLKALLFGFMSFCLSFSSNAQELKAEEIVAKHLASIGKADVRALVSNRVVTGLSQFTSKLPETKGGGKAVIVSDKENLYFMISLNSKEYPNDKVGFFKDKVSLPFVTAGARSPLGAFIADHKKLLDNGLFLGSMIITVEKSKMRVLRKLMDGRHIAFSFSHQTVGQLSFSSGFTSMPKRSTTFGPSTIM